MLIEEIQISENEIATDSDRHRSLTRHRRVLENQNLVDRPIVDRKGGLSRSNNSLFSSHGPVVMI
jgi:hypothetical protein